MENRPKISLFIGKEERNFPRHTFPARCKLEKSLMVCRCNSGGQVPSRPICIPIVPIWGSTVDKKNGILRSNAIIKL